MRFAYADPPYPGQATKHYAKEAAQDGRTAREVNHPLLIAHLGEFDAWALSTSSSALRDVLPLCPPGTRVAAWVKGWCSWKRNVWPAYAWEPVLFFGSVNLGRDTSTPRDWMQCNVTTGEPVAGTKPAQFWAWLFHMLGARRSDEFVDVFPGSGAGSRAWAAFLAAPSLFDEATEQQAWEVA